MGRRMYSLLIGEMVRVDTILDKGLKPQQNSQLGCGDTGWGKEGGKVEHVHFNTSIAKSYYVLEKTALSRRPGMRHRESRTIREYVAALKKAFPSLKQALCDGQHTHCTYNTNTRARAILYFRVCFLTPLSRWCVCRIRCCAPRIYRHIRACRIRQLQVYIRWYEKNTHKKTWYTCVMDVTIPNPALVSDSCNRLQSSFFSLHRSITSPPPSPPPYSRV